MASLTSDERDGAATAFDWILLARASSE